MSLEARMAAGAKAKGYFQQEVLSLLARRETKRNEERTLRAEWPGIGSRGQRWKRNPNRGEKGGYRRRGKGVRWLLEGCLVVAAEEAKGKVGRAEWRG